MRTTLLWFRNDLRTSDHEPLNKAAQEGKVIPLYCFDPRHFETTSFGFAKTDSIRAQFLLETVADLQRSFQHLGSDLIIRSGKPEEIIPQLVEELSVDQVFVHKEVTSEEVNVEEKVEGALKIPVRYFWGSTLFHPEDVPFSRKTVPDVFTPFRKKLEKYTEVRERYEEPESLTAFEFSECGTVPNLEELGLTEQPIDERSVLNFKGGSTEARKRLTSYFWETNRLRVYKKTRNGLLGADYSSKFSPWLANGAISAKEIYWEVKKFEQEREKNDSTYWLIFELIWRDYFRFSAWKYGDKIFKEGGIQEKNRSWSTDMEVFNRWAKGETGIPFIDANMRELNTTGFMSNRGRQNVASFLAQNLNIDWRLGAEYFESKLIDYDVCSNFGNWAYNATVGHDPRNRFFNILGQAKRYDADGKFVKHWIPELRNVPKEHIHEPYNENATQTSMFTEQENVDYPTPMIDLEKSYEEIKTRD